MQESNQEVTRVISLLKMAENVEHKEPVPGRAQKGQRSPGHNKRHCSVSKLIHMHTEIY